MLELIEGIQKSSAPVFLHFFGLDYGFRLWIVFLFYHDYLFRYNGFHGSGLCVWYGYGRGRR